MNLPSKRLILVQIFLIFILPVFLIYFNILDDSWRMVLLAVGALVIYGIIMREHWSFEDMGLHHHNFKKSFPFYLSFTIIGILALFILHSILNIDYVISKTFLTKTLILFIPISFFQEFVFRSFLVPRLKELYGNNLFVIFINAILFTFIHIIYPNLVIGLPIAFFSGIFFTWLYVKYPNLLLVSFSHIILNITAILLGFFVIK